MSDLVVSGIRHRLGQLDLRVDELHVTSGTTLVIYGPNGSGKTTLLRLLAGTLPGVDPIPAAYLPQRPYMFRGSTRHNLLLGVERPGLAMAMASRLGLGEVLDRPAASLSGGERQRLALARTLARPEPIVMLDEPLAAVDARSRPLLAARLKHLLTDRTALVVTHDRETAAVIGDEMAVMLEGRVRQRGTVAEVLTLPSDEELASVVGVRNLLKGQVAASDGALVQLAAPIEIWGVGDVAPGARAAALFGAEAVTVFAGESGDPGSARNRWRGTVVDVRPLGRLVDVVVDVGVPVVASLTPGSIEALQLAVGAPVTLAVKATAVRVVAA